MKEIKTLLVAQQLVIAPLYIDDHLLARIALGEKADRWSAVRPMLLREGMPTPRRSMGQLYYLPAVVRFFDSREGVAPRGFEMAQDGPTDFDP